MENRKRSIAVLKEFSFYNYFMYTKQILRNMKKFLMRGIFKLKGLVVENFSSFESTSFIVGFKSP